MKKIRIIALMLILALSMQVGVIAANNDVTITSSQIQPRGQYLLSGTSIITPYSGYVKVTGTTDAYYDVDKITVELTVYRINASGSWTEVWSNSKSATDDFEVSIPSTRINLDSGYYYAIEGKHTVKHNGVTETTYTNPDPVYVY